MPLLSTQGPKAAIRGCQVERQLARISQLAAEISIYKFTTLMTNNDRATRTNDDPTSLMTNKDPAALRTNKDHLRTN